MATDTQTNVTPSTVTQSTDANLRLPLDVVTTRGQSLASLSAVSPVLLVFLRHTGCTFARQTFRDLQLQRAEIERAGAKIVLVHMEPAEQITDLLAQFKLDDVDRISDPEQQIYRAFQIARGSLNQVAGPAMWGRAISSLLGGNGFGRPGCDVFQLPGAVVISSGKPIAEFKARTSADRPDYVRLVQNALRLQRGGMCCGGSTQSCASTAAQCDPGNCRPQ